jgi:predicted peroxiredoxin
LVFPAVALVGWSGGRVAILQAQSNPKDAPYHYARAAFAMGFAHRIVVFSDATRVVEYPCKNGLWKVLEQHSVAMYPREQHGIGAKVWPAMA